MKTFLTGMFLVASLSSATAFATNINAANPTVTADAAGCVLLGSPVTINLSSNVKAAYSCSTDDNVIKFSSCHLAGSRKIDTIKCVNSGTTDEPDWNGTGCASTEDTFKSGNFGKAFRATTAGGGVAGVSLTNVCADSTVDASLSAN